MAVEKSVRLRVGVVGLGRLWETRHKPAMAKMRDRFQVAAVYDQVARRAEIEAGQLACRAVDGLHSLMERPDVDVVYLLSPQWFGAQSIEIACSIGKPIYCALPVLGDLEDLERLDPLVRSSGVPFMPEFARRFYPTTLRLRELLATRLGPARLVIGQNRLFGFDRYAMPGPSTQISPAPILIDPGSYLVDWCRFLFEAEPTAVQGWSGTILPSEARGEPDHETFILEFEGGGMAQFSAGLYHRSAWGEASRVLPQPGIQVFAERGAAWLDLPDRILWTDSEGSHEERFPMEPTVGEVLGDHFHRLIRGEPSLVPGWSDSIAVARLVALIRQSAQEGRRLSVANPVNHPGGP